MRTATENLGEGGGRFLQHDDFTADAEARKLIGTFIGTENPRHLRVLHALLRRPMPREQIDREAGCSNGPDLVAELRRLGLALPCPHAPVIDRDGREVQRGIYHLTPTDRRKIREWLVVRGGGRG